MPKPRRGIKFNHRSDGRRSSFSDISEGPSEPGSPVKSVKNGAPVEVRSPSPIVMIETARTEKKGKPANTSMCDL